jgi:hypothetical protein
MPWTAARPGTQRDIDVAGADLNVRQARCVGGITRDIARALAVTNDPQSRGPSLRRINLAACCLSTGHHGPLNGAEQTKTATI